MFFAIIAALGGDIFLQSFRELPSLYSLYIVLGISISIILFAKKFSRLYIFIAFFGLGFGYSGLYANQILSWTLPKILEGKSIVIEGEIASIPVMNGTKMQFDFKTSDALLRLNWEKAERRLIVGDRWHLAVRLKRIHASQNKGAMDFEAVAIQKKLRAKGSVDLQGNNQLISHHWYHFPLNHLRQKLLLKIQKVLPHSESSLWLIGLIVGERSNISHSAWQVLRNTGTNHLMAIAGLHIGIIAGFIHWLCMRNRRFLMPLFLKWPLHFLAAFFALVGAAYYSAAAGFSIPTERAILMLCLFVLVLFRRKKVNAWHIWSSALFFVLILNPLSVLADSFWLSFVTIGLIIYGMRGRMQPSGFWWHWGRVQWVIALGLIPLGIAFFQECSLISVLVNSIAIPWLSFLILPFCLLAGFILPMSIHLGQFFLLIADKSLSLLWMLLTWFSGLKIAILHLAMPNIPILLLSTLAMILFLLPKGVAGRWFGCFLLLPLILPVQVSPPIGDYWVTLLDVGQGLSVVVRTNQHNLLFDTGPKYGESLDAGVDIIVPYLRQQNIKHLHTVILSHSDNDHRGGMPSVMQNIAIDEIITSVPTELPFNTTKRCLAGDTWQWDGVKFEILHPSRSELGYGNDSCCVLSIDNGHRRVLLTADIESWAENRILERYHGSLKADILIAPHHGSKTSSSLEFIRTIQPRYVLFPVGYLNSYHFPHEKTLNTYSELHVRQLDSANHGAIEFKLSSKLPITAAAYRKINKHYWFD